MPYYDPAMEALVAEMLTALDPASEPDVLTYIEQLRAVQAALVAWLAEMPTGTPHAQAEREAVLRFALGKLNPKPEDMWLGLEDVLRRLLECVDVELSKWTSAVTQVQGPSGFAVLPEAEVV